MCQRAAAAPFGNPGDIALRSLSYINPSSFYVSPLALAMQNPPNVRTYVWTFGVFCNDENAAKNRSLIADYRIDIAPIISYNIVIVLEVNA